MTTLGQLQNAQGAKSALASAGTEQKNDALLAMADALEKAQERILDANREDLTAARSLISEVYAGSFGAVSCAYPGHGAGNPSSGSPSGSGGKDPFGNDPAEWPGYMSDSGSHGSGSNYL